MQKLKKEKVEPAQSEIFGPSIPIRRGQIDSVVTYEITEYEFEVLQRGNPNSIMLNLAIFLLSIAATLIVTLLTVKIEDSRLFFSFFVVTVVCLIIGGILLILWFNSNRIVSTIVSKIESRLDNSAYRELKNDGKRISS